MELSLYFDKTSVLEEIEHSQEHTFASNVVFAEEDNVLVGVDIVIMGVCEDRNSITKGSAGSPDHIRKELYKLTSINGFHIADLGNLKIGKTIEDTYVALSEVLSSLDFLGATSIILGGSQDLILAVLDGLNKSRKKEQIKFVNIDSTLDIKDKKVKSINAHNFLGRAYREKTIDIANLAYQKHLCLSKDKYAKNIIENISLGELRDDFMLDAEPVLREADVVGVDVGVLKASEFPALEKPNANGLNSEELCKLMVFSGVSPKVSCVGFFNYLPEHDNRNISSFLLAQAVWYFCDSFMYRVDEHPSNTEDLFKKYIVSIEDTGIVSTFYQSEVTGRFWVDVATDVNNTWHNEEHKFVPCTDFDFEEANKGKVSPRLFYNLTKDSEQT
ncbi:MAG: arginase family protein [Bacteroidales bacterium]